MSKPRIVTRAQHVINAHLAQLATGELYSYEYRLDPIDPCAIQVRRNMPGSTWREWGEFDSWRSAELALELLRMAQVRDAAEREQSERNPV